MVCFRYISVNILHKGDDDDDDDDDDYDRSLFVLDNLYFLFEFICCICCFKYLWCLDTWTIKNVGREPPRVGSSSGLVFHLYLDGVPSGRHTVWELSWFSSVLAGNSCRKRVSAGTSRGCSSDQWHDKRSTLYLLIIIRSSFRHSVTLITWLAK
jgi:hypothetical protein